tara:strand:+ start:460 stop:654 length:195 start_codon:yes stop_codon:yes gene_type:complete
MFSLVKMKLAFSVALLGVVEAFRLRPPPSVYKDQLENKESKDTKEYRDIKELEDFKASKGLPGL